MSAGMNNDVDTSFVEDQLGLVVALQPPEREAKSALVPRWTQSIDTFDDGERGTDAPLSASGVSTHVLQCLITQAMLSTSTSAERGRFFDAIVAGLIPSTCNIGLSPPSLSMNDKIVAVVSALESKSMLASRRNNACTEPPCWRPWSMACEIRVFKSERMALTWLRAIKPV